jgi:hypothetical protein
LPQALQTIAGGLSGPVHGHDHRPASITRCWHIALAVLVSTVGTYAIFAAGLAAGLRRLILRIFTCFIIFMSKLLIISHAPSANTRKLTDAVLAGACDPSFKGVNVQYKQPLETGPEEVMAADGIILGTTENFGYMSGAMKDFFDRIFYPCLEHTEAMPYAMFVRAGQDGLGAKTSIERIVAGLNWKAVQDPLICKGETENFIEPCRQLGMLMAAGLEGSIF